MDTTKTMLTEADVARLLKVHRHTVRNWRLAGTGPPAHQFRDGRKLVRYHPDDVAEWLKGYRLERSAAST